jgi:hypothetical protein
LRIVAVLLALGAAGCGDDVGPRHPVEGQVLLNGKPAKGLTGSVLFVPDLARGNLSPIRAGGQIDAVGRYRLSTKGRSGAPAGWYKVVVNAVPAGTGDREVVKRPVINLRYMAEKATPLSIEVVANPAPGSYDLKVTRN